MKRNRKHRFPKTLKRKMLKRQGDQCLFCGTGLTMITASPHHVIHVSQGGATTKENCQILCWPCHNKVHGVAA